MVRDARGRFVKGHKNISPGRPNAETYQEAFTAAVSIDDAIEIINKAKEQAKRGNAAARKFIFDYLIGLPIQKMEHGNTDGQPFQIEVVYSGEQDTD